MNKQLAFAIGAASAAISVLTYVMTLDEVFDLANWKLTLPLDCSSGTSGTACEVKQPERCIANADWHQRCMACTQRLFSGYFALTSLQQR